MTRALSRPRKTIDDLLALPEGVRAELIGGELYVTPSPAADHQRIVCRLLTRLDAWAAAGGRGEALPAPLDVYLPLGEVVQPDVVYVSEANLGITQGWVRGVPDLLVEVISSSYPERDRLMKREIYLRNGVPEYWLVDLVTATIEILRLEGGAYVPAGYFDRGSILTTESLPGFRLALDDVFP